MSLFEQEKPQNDFEFETTVGGLSFIKPYKHNGAWVWDDDAGNRRNFAPAGSVSMGLSPIVIGADRLISEAARQKEISEPEKGFLLFFSEEPFPEADVEFQWVEQRYTGDIYNVIQFGEPCAFQLLSGQQAWLCPDLRTHYEVPPQRLFIQIESADYGK